MRSSGWARITACALAAVTLSVGGALATSSSAYASERTKIVNYNSGRCVHANYSQYFVVQRYCKYSVEWTRERRGDRYWIHNGGKCLTARNVDSYVYQQECNVTIYRQKWEIYYVGGTPGGTALYRIKNAATGRCLGVEGGSTVDGVRLIHWPCGSYRDHKWYFR